MDSALGNVIDYINPMSSKTSTGLDLCVSPGTENAETTKTATAALSLTCPSPETQLRCDLRGSLAPAAGSCVFRRSKEARRAMGKAYLPWAAVSAISTVEVLTARCSSARYLHLTDPNVYDEYPQLKISPTCFDVVGCSPKESCRGNNTCSAGYEYNKYKCQQWNEKNPAKNSCQTDDECRSRSGKSDKGLGSACSLENPEDCSRCKLGPIDFITGLRNGTCECVGGAPRCGLCTQPQKYDDDDERDNIKGYFRLNNECQECPENPELILILLVSL